MDMAAPSQVTIKRPKHFLDQKDALALADSIASAQEDNALIKIGKHHQAQLGHSQRKHRVSSSKVKLKETKALLAAQRTRSKKEKVQLRKELIKGESSKHRQEMSNDAVNAAPKKRVSFV